MDLENQLTYLEETKEQIKQALIQKGSSISDQDTFRSFVQQINNISTTDNIFDRFDIVTLTDISNSNLEISVTDFINIWQINTADIYKDDIIVVKIQNITEKKQGIKLLRFNKIENDIVYLNLEYNWLSYYENTMDADAEPWDIAFGKTAYVKGQKIQGSIFTIESGEDLNNDRNVSFEYGPANLIIQSDTNNSILYRSGSKIGVAVRRGEKCQELGAIVGLTPNILLKGNTVLDINGTAIALKGQIKEVIPTTEDQIITPDEGFNALTQVTVKATEISEDLTEQLDTQEQIIAELKNELENKAKSKFNVYASFANPMITSTNTCELARNLIELDNIDISGLTNMYGMFRYLSSLRNIPMMDTSKITTMREAFRSCGSITELPALNTKNVTNMRDMCNNCWQLVNMPIFDTSSVTNMANTFTSCPNLSNESLNNILEMCINAINVTTKTLKYIGLTQEQVNICQTLSNWDAFIEAGWTTGYTS